MDRVRQICLATVATVAMGGLLATLLVLAAPLAVRPASAQTSCSAADAASLLVCIDAYNNETSAVTHTVTLTASITESISIDNASGATLELNGNGQTLSAHAEAEDAITLMDGNLQLSNIVVGFATLAGLYITGGDATISNSTFTFNGSGIEIATGALGSLEVINSTFINNDDGLLLNEGTSITVRHSTIVDSIDLGIRHETNATSVLIGSLIAGNPDGNCNGGVHTGSSNNVIDDASCSGLAETQGVVGTYNQGLLANTSGLFVPIVRLLPGSPAIDAAGDCAPVTTDQLGMARTAGQCDAGAFELGDCDAETDVADEEQLAFVIGCYNIAGSGETVTANVTGDIQLTDELIWISNTVDPDGPQLVINGNGRTITGDLSTDVIRVAAGDLTLNDAEVTGSNGGSSGVLISGGVARINGSTLHGNGFGIAATDFSFVAVTNSTITGNGGGAGLFDSAELHIRQSTIAYNSGPGIQGSLAGTGTLTLDGSIVVDNGGGAQCVGVVNPTTSDTNVIRDTSCGGNSTQSQFATLATDLEENGCNAPCTQTLAIYPASAAVDRAGTCNVAVDQRGMSRTVGKCDAGAFEVGDCFQVATVGTLDELQFALSCHTASPADTTNSINLSADIELAGQTLGLPFDPTLTLLFDGNGFALDGGGITGIGLIQRGGALELTNLTVRNTHFAVIAAAGTTNIDGITVSGNETGIESANNAQVSIENSTITGNTDTGVSVRSSGGTSIVNSTIHDNGGSGVLVEAATGDATVVIRQSTVTNNGGFGIEHSTPSTFSVTSVLADSIAADNASADCDQPVTTNVGDNVISDPTCTGSATNGVGATLGALADNGGRTQTRALLAGSPAIDAAKTCQVPTDQRGVARATGKCDAGAFELGDLVAATCNGLAITVNLNLGQTPTENADVILGTPGDDTINSLGGNDTICAGAGNDTIDAGAGDDTAFGEDGDDTIVGGDGDDTMAGGPGRDIIRGNPGADTINGDAGNDRLLGGIDNDTINGGTGNDYIGGFGGSDTIDGGPGNETIFGGFGSDIIDGGDGDDSIFGLIGNDTITGGAGNDLLNGDRGNDTINGGVGDDNINGGNANDELNGNGGDDTISGGRADDTLSGGAGADICIGNKHIIADTADATCETTFGVP